MCEEGDLITAFAHARPRCLRWKSVAAAFALAAATGHALAIDRLALVVGNDAYQQISPLINSRNDAQLIAKLLKDAQFDVTLVEDAGRVKLWRAIDTFRSRIRKGDEVVFYFAGHGMQVGADPVLLPVDISADNENQVARDGVPVFKVQDAFKDARAALLIIDACRNNPFEAKGLRGVGGTRGLTPIEAAEGTAIVMSAGRGQTALDSVPGGSAKNGLFTHELVDILRTPGLGARAALLEARERVEAAARSVGHAQRPSLVDEMRGDFLLFPGPAVSSTGPRPPGSTPPTAPAPAPAPARTTATTANGGQPEALSVARVPAAPSGAPADAVRPGGSTDRRVQLLWDSPTTSGSPGLAPTASAQIESAFVSALLEQGVPLTLPAKPVAGLDATLSAAASTSSHVMLIKVVPDAASPIGVGFQVSVRSADRSDYELSQYSTAVPPAEPPKRRFKFVATDAGFKKVEITEPVVFTFGDFGKALAAEIGSPLQRIIQQGRSR